MRKNQQMNSLNEAKLTNREILHAHSVCVKVARLANCNINFRSGERVFACAGLSNGSGRPDYLIVDTSIACLVDKDFPEHIVASSSQSLNAGRAICDLLSKLKKLSEVQDLDSLSTDEYRAKAAYDEMKMSVDLFGNAALDMTTRARLDMRALTRT